MAEPMPSAALLAEEQEQQQQQQQQQQQGQPPAQQQQELGAGQRLVGRWALLTHIGAGSFAIVWRARHVDSGAEAAVKEINLSKLNSKLRQSLESEVSILKRVRHENIVTLLEVLEVRPAPPPAAPTVHNCSPSTGEIFACRSSGMGTWWPVPCPFVWALLLSSASVAGGCATRGSGCPCCQADVSRNAWHPGPCAGCRRRGGCSL